MALVRRPGTIGWSVPLFLVADLVRSITSHATGHWYFEVTIDVATDLTKVGVGIDNNAESLTLEAGRAGAICWLGGGTVNYNGTPAFYTAMTFLVGDVLCIDANLDAGTIAFRVNGGAWSSAFSIAAILTGPMYALAQLFYANDQVTANFTGTSPAFAFTIAPSATAWG